MFRIIKEEHGLKSLDKILLGHKLKEIENHVRQDHTAK